MATDVPWWISLVREQLAAGFPDVAGAEVSATVPISDRLLTRVVRERLPPTAPIGDVDLRAHPAGRLIVRVRLARPAFLRPITLPVTIVRQPALPHDPVLVLRVGSPGGLLRLAGPFVRLMDALPPGVTLEKDVVSVNLQGLLAARGAAFALDYLDQLDIGTAEGRVVLSLRARVGSHAPSG